MTVVWVLLGVASGIAVGVVAARFFKEHEGSDVRREAERGVQELERYLAEVR